MAALSAHVVQPTGLRYDNLLVPADGDGDSCPTGQGVLLVVKNADSAAHTVTLATPQTISGLAVADRTVSVPNGGTSLIPLLDLYRDPETGRAAVTYDAVTSVTVAVVRS
ncbi:hypothetical protein [Streptomyces sp. DW26H14]|uniref:hypothetical protein n=1 Tax=Streptomyces sp. DW26H14 TaxID=3435395 RepID=UPI00403E032C